VRDGRAGDLAIKKEGRSLNRFSNEASNDGKHFWTRREQQGGGDAHSIQQGEPCFLILNIPWSVNNNKKNKKSNIC
jgi:hypothetical protein